MTRPDGLPDLVLRLPAASGLTLVVEPTAEAHALDRDTEVRLWWHADAAPTYPVATEEDGLVVVVTIDARYYEVGQGDSILEAGGFAAA